MANDETIRIIGNESNNIIEVEGSESRTDVKPQTTAEKVAAKQQQEDSFTDATRTTGEITANDGSLVETADTALHHKPGIAEGENISGSDRADYYEARSQGKPDAEEELSGLSPA